MCITSFLCFLFCIPDKKMNLPSVKISTAAMLIAYYDPKAVRFMPEPPVLQESGALEAVSIQPAKTIDLCSTDKYFLKKYTNAETSQIKYEILQCEIKTADFSLKEMFVIGHRGHGMDSFNTSLGSARENTIKSFMLAHEKKAQMVEMDIHMTKDGRLVVFHDDMIRGKMVADMSYLEFIEQTESKEEDWETTNTALENILKHLPDDLALYLEIKYNHKHSYGDFYEVDMLQTLLALLQLYPNRKIMFASFSPLICGLLKGCCPKYKTCFLIGKESLDFFNGNDDDFCKAVLEFVSCWNIDGIVVDTEIVPRIGSIIRSSNGGLCLMCYGDGANDMGEVRKLKEMGFSGFCTDTIDIYAL